MKLSTKGRYGLRAMMDLAAHETVGAPVLLSDIAKRQGISEKYLEQIFTTLRTTGLVRTVRGRKGGFLLTGSPKELTAGAIISALEGSCKLVECVSKPDICTKAHTCAARDVWCLLESKIEEVQNGFTLEQLVLMQKDKSLSDTLMYHI